MQDNITTLMPGVASVKEKVKTSHTTIVSLGADGLICTPEIEDSSAIIEYLSPAKELFIKNPSILCRIGVIDKNYSSLYRMNSPYCILEVRGCDIADIANACKLPYTPTQAVMLTPSMVLQIKQIAAKNDDTNIVKLVNFNNNALSMPGAPIYGLLINNIFIKDNRCSIVSKTYSEKEWSSNKQTVAMLWRMLVTFANAYIAKNDDAAEDDICIAFIKEYGIGWCSSLVSFRSNHQHKNIPVDFMKLFNSEPHVIINIYDLMISILRGKCKGDNDKVVSSLQDVVVNKLTKKGSSDEGDKEDSSKSEDDKKEDKDTKKKDK